jgi:LCP family protein required for cell wall assembly
MLRSRRRWPTAGGAALRSAILPGWGQFAAGAPRRGLLFLFLALALTLIPLLVGAALLRPLSGLLHSPILDQLAGHSQGAAAVGDILLDVITRANWNVIWRAALGANVAVALFRLLISLDAAVTARARREAYALRAPIRSGFAGLLAIGFIVVPHVALGAAGYAVQPLLAAVIAPPTKASKPAVTAAPSPDFVVAPTPDPDAGRPVWDGTSRLNVLLLGTDQRPQEAAAEPWGNSDTILLVSVDPGLQGAAMISVPRDLFLQNIPTVGPEKINAAYRMGGPQLAIKVVGDLLGQPIHRWASIDTTAFAKMIDAVGGVVVDVEHPIRDDEYPNPDYSIRRIYIPAGLQWLDGERALWYARSRHETNDFDRGLRQQRLMLSLKDRLRDPATVRRLPVLMDTLAGAVQTDITPREALALARLASTRDVGSVRSLVLQPPVYGREIIRPDLYAIEPNIPRIRQDVAAALSPGGPGAPGAPLAIPTTVRALPDLPIGVLGQGGPGPDSEDDSP